ncbi:hypothetical protein BSNK01_31190 [Bacillaceae bacterium]
MDQTTKKGINNLERTIEAEDLARANAAAEKKRANTRAGEKRQTK